MIGVLGLLACARPGTATVIDTRTGTPIPGLDVRAWGEEGPCPTTVAPSDGDGRFLVPAGCTGAGWRLRPTDPTWWAPDAPVAREGAVVDVWRVPDGGGVALLDGDTLRPIATHTAVDLTRTLEGAELAYPVEIPADLPRVVGSALLVLDAEDLRVEPLLAGEPRALGAAALPVRFGPWFYFGARLPADGPPEVVSVAPSGIVEARGGARIVRYLGADALPPGRYGVRHGNRAVLVDFGAP